MSQESQNSQPIDQMLLNSSLFYGIMAIIAALIIHFQQDGFLAILQLQTEQFSLGDLLILSGLAIGVLLVASFLFEEFFPSLKAYKSALVRYIGSLPLAVGLYLAVISAVAEQLLFQGAILPEVGSLVVAILFTLVHLGPGSRLGPWTLLAFTTGLVFAWMAEATETIFPSLLAHIVVNCVHVTLYRRRFFHLQPRQDLSPSIVEDEDVVDES